MVTYNLADLSFILTQIKIAEAHAAGTPLTELVTNPLLPFGLRTVDGSLNNIIPGREDWGSADQEFPRLVPADYDTGTGDPTFDINGPGPGGTGVGANYAGTGNVVDTAPRTISNLIVDQTVNNPAAVRAALEYAGFSPADAQSVIDDHNAAVAAARLFLQQQQSEAANALATSNAAQTTLDQANQALASYAAAQAETGGASADAVTLNTELAELSTALANLDVVQAQIELGEAQAAAAALLARASAARNAIDDADPGSFIADADVTAAQAFEAAVQAVIDELDLIVLDEPVPSIDPEDLTAASNAVAAATNLPTDATALDAQIDASHAALDDQIHGVDETAAIAVYNSALGQTATAAGDAAALNIATTALLAAIVMPTAQTDAQDELDAANDAASALLLLATTAYNNLFAAEPSPLIADGDVATALAFRDAVQNVVTLLGSIDLSDAVGTPDLLAAIQAQFGDDGLPAAATALHAGLTTSRDGLSNSLPSSSLKAARNAAQTAYLNEADDVAPAQLALDNIINGYQAELEALGVEFSGRSLVIPNVAPDEGISAPFNSWMTLFGQFFDHGLDLVEKTATTKVYVPLAADDPLRTVGPDGVAGTGDEVPASRAFMVITRTETDARNITTPLVDQNQTYTSHASHQVFLRDYDGAPGSAVANGHLLEGASGGLATWADVKAQAASMLGLALTDHNIGNVPLLATDDYGRFERSPSGFAMVVVEVTLNGTTKVDALVSGETGGVSLTSFTAGQLLTKDADGNTIAFDPGSATITGIALQLTGHAFLDDIAHTANPFNANGGERTADSNGLAGDHFSQLGDDGRDMGNNQVPSGSVNYDNELLDAHFITGDGRGNENIGLTTVHHVFHSEHNRLAEQTKDVVLADAIAKFDAATTPAEEAAAIAFLNEWLAVDVTAATFDPLTVSTAGLTWDGERLFQAARFGTEMQYQHLVFEEFARKVNPMVDLFVFNPTMDLNPAIFAEFAHTVYRFGHSMLTETVARLDADGQTSDDIGLIEAFLNPIEFTENGTVTADEAAGAIVRGMTRQQGNEIDEFVTEALRNNLLGLPLDLATVNIARGRETGIPSLQEARAAFYEEARSEWLKPYTGWADFAQHLKNPASIINFIAAYGNHDAFTAGMTMEERREVAKILVLGDGDDSDGVVINGTTYTDRVEFLNGTSGHTGLGGLNDVDLWIGGLAEAILPFGGMLGSTFTFVFEKQMENLQNGDRFYYLSRTQGTHFLQELENNAFSKMIMKNTDLGDGVDLDGNGPGTEIGYTHLPGEIFSTPQYIIEWHQQLQKVADPEHDDPILEGLDPKVARDLHLTIDGNTYDRSLKFTGGEHVVLGGTEKNDVIIGDLGDDTIWGDGGDDYIEGGHGINRLHGGTGNDIIYGGGDPEFIHGDEGDDVINGGNGLGDLIFGGSGSDFVIAGIDAKEVFAAEGNDFILGTPDMDFLLGGEGDDWIEGGEGFDTIAGENSELFFNSPIIGHDVMFAGTNEMDFDAESGDDIMVQGESVMRNEGMLGFDWVSFEEHETFGANSDMRVKIFTTVADDILRNRFDAVEAMSGSKFGDILVGDDRTSPAGPINPNVPANEATLDGDQLTREGVLRIDGLAEVLDMTVAQITALQANAIVFDDGNILLGGDGSDSIQGNGGNDIIDGDARLNVRISIRDASGNEIGTAEKMQGIVSSPDPALDGHRLDELMFNRTVTPSQLAIVREIVTDTTDNDPASVNYDGDIDTAVFRGSLSEYTFFRANGTVIEPAVGQTIEDALVAYIAGDTGNRLIVEHTAAIDAGEGGGGLLVNDGRDELINVERLSFSDTTINLVGVDNSDPNGTATIRTLVDPDGNSIVQAGLPLLVALNADGSLAGVTDADNVSTSGQIVTFTVTWQAEQTPGAGDFIDAGATGPVFVPPATLGIEGERVRALITYTDENGLVERVVTTPVGPMDPATGSRPIAEIIQHVGTHAVPDNTHNQEFQVAVLAAGLPAAQLGFTLGQTGADGTIAAPFTGTAGEDEMLGLSGDDVIFGGAGDDIVDGGAGNDTAVFRGNIDNFELSLNAEGDMEVLDFNPAVSTEDAVLNIEQLRFEDGNGDVVTLDFADRFAALNALAADPATDPGGISVRASDGDNVLVGTAGVDVIDALAGDDLVLGLGDNDILSGGLGDDDLRGGDGDDVLAGGAGNDIVDGGDGFDTAKIDVPFGQVTVEATPSGTIELIIGGTENEIISIEQLWFDTNNDDIIDANEVISLADVNAAAGLILGTPGDDLALNGNAGDNTIVGGAGNDVINALAGEDAIVWNAGDGRDVINGGADEDTAFFNGEADVAETFRIYTVAAAIAEGVIGSAADVAAGTEIVMTFSVGTGPASIIAELDNIEEIRINVRPVDAETTAARGDTVALFGNFAPTSLNLNTIGFTGTSGNDTFDITGLTSGHRIVFNTGGGSDTIIGTLRPQDVIQVAPGTDPASYTPTTTGGSTVLSNGTHSITYSSNGTPQIEAAPAEGVPNGFQLTAADLAALKALVTGQQPAGEDDVPTGVRTLDGHGNNVAHPTYGAADEPFIRITDASYGENGSVNPIHAGLDPRTISNILGAQEADLAPNAKGANILFMAFGQYFDHGLDFLPKGGNGTIAIGGPGYNPGAGNPADLTRGEVSGYDTNGVPQHLNKISPYVDQNQAYGSHSLVGQFLREGDGNGGIGAQLFQGGPDPTNGSFNLLPTLRELIHEHWENNTVFQMPDGSTAEFQSYYAGLIDVNGVINNAMVAGLNANFMGSGQTLVGDANPFISVLDHYVAGDLRANENVTLTSIHTIWARNHNFHVENLEAAGFQGTAEELFQAAKILNEAEYQSVVFGEFADMLIGGIKGSGSHGHNDYNPDADASISHEFAAAVYRVGHSLIGQSITIVDANGQEQQVSLVDAFLNPTNDSFSGPLPPGYVPQPGFEQLGVNGIVQGIVGQQAEEVDFNVVDAVRNDLVRLHADLFAFNVARGWDVGLGTLNQIRHDLAASTNPYIVEARSYAGDLNPYTSWEDFQARNGLSNSVIEQFKQAYPDLVLQSQADIDAFRAVNPDIEVLIDPATGFGTVKGIDRVDVWVGGLAEAHINGGMVGQTFWVVLQEQFDRLQEGDRFYYTDRLEGLDLYENEFQDVTLADIVARNTGLENLPEDIFETPDSEDDNTAPYAPAAIALAASNEDTWRTITEAELLAGSGDPDGDALHITDLKIKLGGGTLVDNGNGTWTYKPAANDDSGVTFSFKVSDGKAKSGTVTASLDLLPVDEPVGLVIRGNDGNNVLIGGAGDDWIRGQLNDDKIFGRGGDDALFGNHGKDAISGGHGDDKISGGLGHDRVDGGAGNDRIYGDSGHDLLRGGDGDDRILGGQGRDTMSGGDGDDRFVWKAVAETGKTASTRDVITDFEGGGTAGGDTIDLSGIDALAGGSNDAFTFKGTNAFDGLGQIRVRVENGNTIISGNVTGDLGADFEIEIKGIVTLTADDFSL